MHVEDNASEEKKEGIDKLLPLFENEYTTNSFMIQTLI